MVGDLLWFAHISGYEVVFSYAYRCKDCLVGQKNSLHKKCLAIDLELFKPANKHLIETKDYTKLGTYWESIGGSWGGRFNKPDGCHFSLKHGSMR